MSENKGYLALTRRENEEVVLDLPDGKQVSVVVGMIGKGQVRLLFSGPADVAINRREVRDRIMKERRA